MIRSSRRGRRPLLHLALLAALLVLGDLAVTGVAAKQGAQQGASASASRGGAGIETVHVRDRVWMLVTPDGNLALQVGTDGALLVDTGRAGTSDAVLAAIRSITSKPLRYVINTSAGPMQVGNNAAFGALRGGVTGGRGPTPAIIAQEGVLTRLGSPAANDGKGYPSSAWPTDAYAGTQRNIRYNGEAIDIIHVPHAYSEADSLVYFRGSDVVVAGEIYSTMRFPLMDRAHGGTVTGVLAGLNRILDITVPDVVVESFAESGTLVIPASGRLSDEDDVTEYRDMVSIVRDRLASLAGKPVSLDQAKAARPLIDYEARYGTPAWTPTMFLEALYAEFASAPARAR